MSRNALRIHDSDNVAVAIREIAAGERLCGIEGLDLEAVETIPKNHKVALAEVATNGPVRKYGEVIGFAAKPIRPGQWVHTHNLKGEGG